jgi:hypothetical protein
MERRVHLYRAVVGGQRHVAGWDASPNQCDTGNWYPPDVGDGGKRRTWATENGDLLHRLSFTSNRHPCFVVLQDTYLATARLRIDINSGAI